MDGVCPGFGRDGLRIPDRAQDCGSDARSDLPVGALDVFTARVPSVCGCALLDRGGPGGPGRRERGRGLVVPDAPFPEPGAVRPCGSRVSQRRRFLRFRLSAGGLRAQPGAGAGVVFLCHGGVLLRGLRRACSAEVPGYSASGVFASEQDGWGRFRAGCGRVFPGPVFAPLQQPRRSFRCGLHRHPRPAAGLLDHAGGERGRSIRLFPGWLPSQAQAGRCIAGGVGGLHGPVPGGIPGIPPVVQSECERVPARRTLHQEHNRADPEGLQDGRH
ncbi:hypothetical protein ES703_106673 [subsurface metagenome]